MITIDKTTLAVIEKDRRDATIRVQLAALDTQRIRPLAEGDSDYLEKLNEQLIALRGQMK